MTTPRYFLAKYVPDLTRMEPRNVGVVLWSPHGVLARFAAEKPGRPGDVDGRSTLQFGITSHEAYRQWIEFWRAEMARHEVVHLAGGAPVPRTSPAFLDVLASWNKGNFLLAEGGYLLDPINTDDLPCVLDDLYARLVDGLPSDEPRDPRLDEICAQLITRTKIDKDPHFRPHFVVPCQIATGVEETFEFSYAYGNGSPERLFQRVPLSSRRTHRLMLKKTVDSTAWMFEKVVQKGIVSSQHHVVSLVYALKEQLDEPEISRGIKVLESVSRVLNLSNEQEAVEEFTGLPRLLRSHH